MKESRHTLEQVAFCLRQAGQGTLMAEVCRKLGLSRQIFYRWGKQFDTMEVAG